MTPHEYLLSISACPEARTWASQYDTMQAIIDNCDKIDWLTWLVDHAGTMKQRVSFSCDAVRNTPLADGRKVWDLLTDERSRSAIVVGEAYAEGNATEEERAAARDAAGAAARAAAWDAAGDAAGDAARAAARAAAWDAAGDAQVTIARKHLHGFDWEALMQTKETTP